MTLVGLEEWLVCPDCGNDTPTVEQYSGENGPQYKVSCGECGNRTWLN